MPQAGKRHGMIKRTNSQIRKQRGTTIMTKQDTKIVKSLRNKVNIATEIMGEELKAWI